MDSRLQHESCPLLNPCIVQAERTPLKESVELYGLTALHTPAVLAGVNKFRRSTPMCNKTKDTARKEESHAEATDGQRRNAPL